MIFTFEFRDIKVDVEINDNGLYDIDFNGHYLIQVDYNKDETFIPTGNAIDGFGNFLKFCPNELLVKIK